MATKAKKHTDDPSRAGELKLVGRAVALDFANTSSGRDGPQRLDHLREPEHVVAWAEHEGLVDPATAARVRARLDAGDPAFAALLPNALALREAIYGVATEVAAKRTPAKADLETIRTACARAIAGASLAPASDGFRWAWPTDPPIAETLLGPIALSAAGLLRESDLSRVKQCPGEHCGWVFFDLSKNNTRRWCEMAVCGNRDKAKRFAGRGRTA